VKVGARRTVQISESFRAGAVKDPNTLSEGQYRRAERRENVRSRKLQYRRRPQGGDHPAHLADEKCKTHQPILTPSLAQGGAAQKARALQFGSEGESRSAFAGDRQKLPLHWRARTSSWSRWYFRRLVTTTITGFQVYGWEEKKIKTSWGGNSVEHEKVAEVQIRAMTVDDLKRFVVSARSSPTVMT